MVKALEQNEITHAIWSTIIEPTKEALGRAMEVLVGLLAAVTDTAEVRAEDKT